MTEEIYHFIQLHPFVLLWKSPVSDIYAWIFGNHVRILLPIFEFPLTHLLYFEFIYYTSRILHPIEALLEAFPEAAGMTNNYGNLALHFTAWKKGPLDVERLLLKVFPEGELPV